MPLGDRIRRLRSELRAGGRGPVAAPQPLLSSRQLLSELEERYQIGLWFWDYRSKTFDWDAGLRRMNGVAVDAPIPSCDLVSRQFPSDDPWIMESVIDHALPVSAWVNVVKRQGASDAHHLCHVNILKDEQGIPDLAIGFVQDISAYRRREELLVAYQSSNKAMSEGQGIVSWVSVLKGEILFSSGLTQMTGCSENELAGDALLQVVHPADRAAVAKWRMAIDAKAPPSLRLRVRVRRSDGDYTSYAAFASVLDDPRQGRRLENWSCIPEDGSPDEIEPAQLTPQLLRAARALLGWTVQMLSSRSDVSTATIARYEAGSHLRAASFDSLVVALRRAGVSLEQKPDGAVSLHFRPPS